MFRGSFGGCRRVSFALRAKRETVKTASWPGLLSLNLGCGEVSFFAEKVSRVSGSNASCAPETALQAYLRVRFRRAFGGIGVGRGWLFQHLLKPRQLLVRLFSQQLRVDDLCDVWPSRLRAGGRFCGCRVCRTSTSHPGADLKREVL